MKKFKRFFTAVCAMLLSHALTVSGAELKSDCEPYLRFIDNRTAVISFVVSGTSAAGYAVEFAAPWRPVEKIPAQGVQTAPGKWVCSAEIKNLTPGLICTYTLVGADGSYSKDYTFTVPSAEQSTHTVFVTSDVHERANMLGKMMKSGRKAGAALYVLLGDSVGSFDENAHRTMMESFLRKLADRAQGNTPVAVLRGNHDFYGQNSNIWYKFFPAANDRTYYSLRMGNVFYIMLDSGDANQPGLCRKLFEHQRQWLEQELQSAACRTAQFRVVMVHYPSHAIAEEVSTVSPLPLLGDLLMSSDPDKRIHLMLAGHRHRYIRTDAFSDTFKVNASGFSDTIAGLPGKTGKNYPYTLVICDSGGHGGSAEYNYLLLKGSPDKLTVQAFDGNDRQFDAFTIAPDGKVTDLMPVKTFK